MNYLRILHVQRVADYADCFSITYILARMHGIVNSMSVLALYKLDFHLSLEPVLTEPP